MAREWTMRSFKSGNSVALRVPAAAGIAPGEEWRLVETSDGFEIKRQEIRRKIDVDAFWGKSPGIGLIPPADRLFEDRPSQRASDTDGAGD